MSQEFEIYEGQIPLVRERVDAANARAARRGLLGTLEASFGPVVHSRRPVGAEELMCRVCTVTIEGRTAREGDFEVQAVVKTLPGENPESPSMLVHEIDGAEVNAEQLSIRPGWCEECRTTRRRDTLFLVRELSTGRVLQVGGDCLENYVGTRVARPSGLLQVDEDEIGMLCERGDHDQPVLDVLAASVHAIRRDGGYRPTSEPGATADHVRALLRASAVLQAGPEDPDPYVRAQEVLDYLRSDAFGDGTSTYVHNVREIIARGAVAMAQVGIIASSVQAYRRWADERAQENPGPSQWFGEVGQRVEFTGVITRVFSWTTYYGSTPRVAARYVITAEDGRIVTWKASQLALGDDTGVTVTIKGTIKEHTIYDDARRGTRVQQTVLTRCAVISGVHAEAA